MLVLGPILVMLLIFCHLCVVFQGELNGISFKSLGVRYWHALGSFLAFLSFIGSF